MSTASTDLPGRFLRLIEDQSEVLSDPRTTSWLESSRCSSRETHRRGYAM